MTSQSDWPCSAKHVELTRGAPEPVDRMRDSHADCGLAEPGLLRWSGGLAPQAEPSGRYVGLARASDTFSAWSPGSPGPMG